LGLISPIRRRIYAPLYSGVELYQIFVSVALFEPQQSAQMQFAAGYQTRLSNEVNELTGIGFFGVSLALCRKGP
jgi:hypothetical protein